MNKKDRQIIFNKFGGKCALCGCDLGKGCSIWDIEPIQTLVSPDGGIKTINTEMKNLIPACKHCNSLRIRSSSHKMTFEEFRAEVIKSFYGLKFGWITGNSYHRAIRFGFIKEMDKTTFEFYFETLNTGTTTVCDP